MVRPGRNKFSPEHGIEEFDDGLLEGFTYDALELLAGRYIGACTGVHHSKNEFKTLIEKATKVLE